MVRALTHASRSVTRATLLTARRTSCGLGEHEDSQARVNPSTASSRHGRRARVALDCFRPDSLSWSATTEIPKRRHVQQWCFSSSEDVE